MKEPHLAHLDHLQRYVEADGDEVAVQHERRHKGVDPRQYGIAGIEGCGCLFWCQVPHAGGQLLGPDGKKDGANKAHSKEQHKHEDDHLVHLVLYPAALGGWQRGILHHLRRRVIQRLRGSPLKR